MRPENDYFKAKLADAKFDLLLAQVDLNLCMASDAAARIAAIEQQMPAEKSVN
jgi:hypothetical protein